MLKVKNRTKLMIVLSMNFTLRSVSAAYPLSIIFQRSFDLGSLPYQFKNAIIVPVQKSKKCKSKVQSYRSISLTSVPSKVAESIIADHISRFLYETNKVSEAQHGFLRRRSTITQLLMSLNIVTKALDQGQFCDIIQLDIQKAFHSVSHPKLFKNLPFHRAQR